MLTKISSVGAEEVLEVFAPVSNQLYFAGEHTTIQLDIRGTMEAACESGERAARIVMQDARCKYK